MSSDSGFPAAISTHTWSPRHWRLRTVPTVARWFLLFIDVLAVLVTSWLLATQRMSPHEWVRLAVLAAIAIGYAEAGARVERLKRYLSPGGDRVVSNQVSVWAFAAVLTVPPGWAAVLIAVLYLQSLVRRSRDKTGVAYRVVFAGATVMLSAEAARAVLSVSGGGDVLRGGLVAPAAVIGALLVFTLVNFGLLMTGMWLTRRPPQLRALLPDIDAFGYEVATLTLGIVTAEFLIHTPALTPVAVVLAAYLHRSSLVNSLHRAAAIDPKTTLPNLAAWTEHAQGVLERVHRRHEPVTVLFCDLDHFKEVNDTYGHLTGDRVLAAVAQCLRQELRGGRDDVGRFGGEEFVVVLHSVDHGEAHLIATRLRLAVSSLTFDHGLKITMSVGIAHHHPGSAPDLQKLLSRADAGLHAAKVNGRNQVRSA